MTVQHVPIGEITQDPRLQMRVQMSEEAIAEYVENLAALPSPRVVDDGQKKWLIDWHRFGAYQKAGKTTIPCVIIKGTFTDALHLAAGANSDHGVRRTTDDKRKAVQTLLGINGYSEMSDSALADICKVSDHFVARVRATSSAGSSQTSEGSSSNSGGKRTGKDGKKRGARHKPGEKPKKVLQPCTTCKGRHFTAPNRACPICMDKVKKSEDRQAAAEAKIAAKKAKEGLKSNRASAVAVHKFFGEFKAVDERNQRIVQQVHSRAAELCDAITKLWEAEAK